MKAEFLFALYSSAGLDSRETSVPVFVFHYLLVIMVVIRKWRVAGGPSDVLFNEPSLEEQFFWLQWKWEMWDEVSAAAGRKVEAKDMKRKLEGSKLLRKEAELEFKGKNKIK